MIRNDSTVKPKTTFGGLSLIAFGVAILFWILMSGTNSETQTFGAIAGFSGFGASIVSFALATIGMWRKEKPRALAVLGLVLSAIPTAIGVWLLIEFFVFATGPGD
jgi:hypothetical protein